MDIRQLDRNNNDFQVAYMWAQVDMSEDTEAILGVGSNDGIKVWLNGIPTANIINNKYKKGYIAFKIHFLGDNPEKEKSAAWIKNVRIITSKVKKYSKLMDIPVKVVE